MKVQPLKYKRKTRDPLEETFSAYSFLSLWLIGVIVFFLWPFAHSIYLSFTNYSFQADYQFVGIQNFRTIFSDSVSLKSISVTLKFAVMSVPLRLAFALFIAVLLNRGLKGLSLYRTLFYIPSLIGHGVAVAIMWRQMFSDRGLVSNFLHIVTGFPRQNWIHNPDSALFMLVLLSVWQFGSSMLIFLAALKQVPYEMYEQAMIDGASKWRQFWKITLPLISPVLFFNLTMNIINAFRMFTQARVITNGGPMNETLMMVLHIYNNAFSYGKMGFASALSWTLLLMIATVTAINFLMSKYWVYYETKID